MKLTPTGNKELDAKIADFKIQFGNDKHAEIAELLGHLEEMTPDFLKMTQKDFGYKPKKKKWEEIQGQLLRMLDYKK